LQQNVSALRQIVNVIVIIGLLAWPKDGRWEKYTTDRLQKPAAPMAFRAALFILEQKRVAAGKPRAVSPSHRKGDEYLQHIRPRKKQRVTNTHKHVKISTCISKILTIQLLLLTN
jgi:hypothetical protein